MDTLGAPAMPSPSPFSPQVSSGRASALPEQEPGYFSSPGACFPREQLGPAVAQPAQF